jgi:hypothetical protein
VRGTTVEGDMVAQLAVGAVASWICKGVVDTKALMVPGSISTENTWGVSSKACSMVSVCGLVGSTWWVL